MRVFFFISLTERFSDLLNATFKNKGREGGSAMLDLYYPFSIMGATEAAVQAIALDIPNRKPRKSGEKAHKVHRWIIIKRGEVTSD